MALSLGKLGILVGAGVLGSVLAKEGSSNFSDMVSGAFKTGLKLIKRDDTPSSVSKPHNDSLMAQVKSLQQELQILSSNRSITIVSAGGNGANKYGIIIVVVIVGYGYVWWKGWKLPDMMFATRRSLSDACTSIAQQLENVYGSIRSTRRELSSDINRVDSHLNEVASLTANTQEKVTEILEDSGRIGHDVKYVRDAVETLELKISRIEGKQDLTNLGVKKLVDYARKLENNSLEENNQASSSRPHITSSTKQQSLPPPSSEPASPSVPNGSIEDSSSRPHITSSSKQRSLPPPSSEPASPSVSNGSTERPFHHSASASSIKTSKGISGAAEISSSGISDVINAKDQSGSSGWFRTPLLSRTLSATNYVLQKAGRQ